MNLLTKLKNLAGDRPNNQNMAWVVKPCSIETTIFDDGDITHKQDILTGLGFYITSDGHNDQYWGGHKDSCVLLSFHGDYIGSESPYLAVSYTNLTLPTILLV